MIDIYAMVEIQAVLLINKYNCEFVLRIWKPNIDHFK